jgi:GNAT superfamily N-acetyltransferase
VPDVVYRDNPSVSDMELNALFTAAWPGHTERGFQQVLRHGLGHVCAYRDGRLVGYVHVAWDGGLHAFLLDTTVHPDHRRLGIGRRLVRRASDLARRAGAEWLHVDYAPEYRGFYLACGFVETAAGLIALRGRDGKEPCRPDRGAEG